MSLAKMTADGSPKLARKTRLAHPSKTLAFFLHSFSSYVLHSQDSFNIVVVLSLVGFMIFTNNQHYLFHFDGIYGIYEGLYLIIYK
jgi:hypothetical protein